MRILRRKFAMCALVAICLNFAVAGSAFAIDPLPSPDELTEKDAQRGTVLPSTTANFDSVDKCKTLMNILSQVPSDERKGYFKDNGHFELTAEGVLFTQSDILGCGIKTGSIGLWMVPYYIRYVLEFAIQIAGLIAVGGIVYGGYLYLFAGVSDEKDKGKKAIMYSVAGMIMTMVAWALVNIVIGFLTG